MRGCFVSLALAGVLWLGGCTGSQGYQAVRDAGEAKARCEQELTVAAQQACEAAYRQSYEDYQAERRRVLEEDVDH